MADRADGNGQSARAEVHSTSGGRVLYVGAAEAEASSAGIEPVGAFTETSAPRPDGPPKRLRSQARVLLAIRDLAFHQEVLDFLEREPRVTVVGAVSQPDALFRVSNTAKPDITMVCPLIARDVRHPAANGRAPNLLVVAEEMTVPILREAIEAGARAVFAWPEEREELARTILAIPREEESRPDGRGKVIAVFGPRGGSGTTFIATHLAAALADQGRKCVLIDLDAGFADVTVALGMGADDDARTVADLLPVAEELSPEHVEDALHHHP
jgi:DNA-binding NarL/FixJ family response regulator